MPVGMNKILEITMIEETSKIEPEMCGEYMRRISTEETIHMNLFSGN